MEGLEDKIKQIAEMLGIKNVPDNAAEIISSLTEKKDDAGNPPTVSSSIGQIPDTESRGFFGQDSRISLLMAVKPYLNSSRKSKLDKCIKYLKASEILRTMNLFDK